jgi:hypothetical protein
VSTSDHSLRLGHRLQLRCTMDSLDDTVVIALAHGRRTLFRRTFSADHSRSDFRLDTWLVRADGAVEVDVFTGDVSWEGHLSARWPWGRWRTILDQDHAVIASFSPAVGEIGGSPVVPEPVVDDAQFGRSQLCTPAVLRIFVDERDRLIADVGQIVKQRMFPDHPPFTFNTVACVGGVKEGAPGLYSDPDSIWFNIFFGYYQLDAAKAEWSRPFGYRSADGIESEIEAEDVVRLGKSDWNWFSNWMYGVPLDSVLPYSDPGMGSVGVEIAAPERIGDSTWHALTLRGVEVASTYESEARGAVRLVQNTIIDEVWRRAFGLPNPRDDHAESFIPTQIDAQIRMAYWEEEDAYHTVIFGGTAPVGAEPTFLAVQMDAVDAVIERSYPGLGFAAGIT